MTKLHSLRISIQMINGKEIKAKQKTRRVQAKTLLVLIFPGYKNSSWVRNYFTVMIYNNNLAII